MDWYDASKAPLEYQNLAWLKDSAALAQGGLWTVHYAQMAYYSFRDQSYAMALLPLCCNFAWELVYALIYPSGDPTEQTVLFTWVALNSLVMYSAARFGPNEWPHAPLVRDHLALIVFLGTLLSMSGHIALAETMGPQIAVMWSAMFCQAFLSVGGICQLLCRGSSRGLSFPLFLTRFCGSWVGAISIYLQYAYWPEQFARANKPFGLWLHACGFVLDLVYAVLLWCIQQKEKTVASKANGKAKSG